MNDARPADRAHERRRGALRLRRGAPRRFARRGDRRRQRRDRRDRQLRRRRGSACACGSAAAGASPPRATSRAPGAEAALARALAVAESQPATPATPLAPVTPALGHWASPYEVDPFAVALEDKLELLFAAERALRTGDERLVRTRRHQPRMARAQGLRLDRGRGVHPGDASPAARGIAAYATDGSDLQVRSYPTRPRRRPDRGRRLGARARPRPRRPCAARRRGGDRAAERAAVPAGHEHDRAARRAGGAAGPRVDRARPRARPDPARRGLLRGHELGRRPATSARCATAPSSCTSPPTRPCPAAWARSAGTTRASPPCAPTSSRAACCAPRCRTARAPRPSASAPPAAARAPTASRASRSCA